MIKIPMIVFGLSMILSGCISDDVGTIASEAAKKAVAETPVNIPDHPDYCRQQMGLVVPKAGEPVWAPQRRWEILRDNTNEQIDWCSRFYDDLQDDLALNQED